MTAPPLPELGGHSTRRLRVTRRRVHDGEPIDAVLVSAYDLADRCAAGGALACALDIMRAVAHLRADREAQGRPVI